VQPRSVSVIISKVSRSFARSRRLVVRTRFAAVAACLIVAGCLIGVGLSPASGASASAAKFAPAKTRVLMFKAFDRLGLRPGVVVVTHAVGHCWTGSISDSEAFAWRCVRGGFIYDPCFSSPYRAKLGYVVCPLYSKGSEEPSRVLSLRLTSPLPSAGDAARTGTRGIWWLIRLRNGVECQTTDGAAAYLRGVPAVYFCDGGAIAGEPKQTAEPWQVRYVSKGARAAVTEIVVVASDG
jgi:hypothetical protein